MSNYSFKVTHSEGGVTISARKNGKPVSATGSTFSKALALFLKLVGLVSVVTFIAITLNSCASEHTLQSVTVFRDGGASDTITFQYKGLVKKDTMMTYGNGWVMKTWEKGGAR